MVQLAGVAEIAIAAKKTDVKSRQPDHSRHSACGLRVTFGPRDSAFGALNKLSWDQSGLLYRMFQECQCVC